MKSNLMKKTLGVLALGSLGLMATGAQADGWQYDNNRNAPYGQPDYREPVRPVPPGIMPAPVHEMQHEMREGFRFSKIINDRQDQQMDRILAGVESDRLNKDEFRALMQEQKNIRAMERGFMADRFMNPAEFQRLNQALDVADWNIQVATQNRDRRYQSPWYWRR